MSDLHLMTALALQHGYADSLGSTVRISTRSARAIAQALHEAGFRLTEGSVDSEQNTRLRALEDRLARIEGYMVVPR